MARNEDDAKASAADGRSRPCTPCRGSGRVISGLDGQTRKVTCPWCLGSGVFVPDADAQVNAPVVQAPLTDEDRPPDD